MTGEECGSNIYLSIFCFRGKNQAAKDVSGRVPMDHYWDNDEPKLLVVQARYQPSEEQTKAEQLQQQPQFSTPLTKAVIDETVGYNILCVHSLMPLY